MNATHSYNGPNYCPNCSCNIRAVALALEAARRIAETGDIPNVSQNGNGITPLLDVPKRTYKPRRRTRMVITDEMRAKVLEMRKQNASIPEIEKATGMTRASVANTIYSKSKVVVPKTVTPAKAPKPTDKRAALLASIRDLTSQRRPQVMIARELGVTPKLVRRIQKEHGLPTIVGRPREAVKTSS